MNAVLNVKDKQKQDFYAFEQTLLKKKNEDSRFILFFFLFSASASLDFSFMQSIFAFFLYSFVLLTKYSKQKKKPSLYYFLLVFCVCCFAFTFIIKSINYTHTLEFLNIREHLLFAFEYALHLALLGTLGLCTFTWMNAIEYMYAIHWYCSFISKEGAWKVALTSLLVLRYFSTMLHLARELKLSVNYVLRKEKSFIKKLTLYMAKLFSLLADKNYELSVALFARRMDKKEVFCKKWDTNSFLSYKNFKIHFIAFFVFMFSLLLIFINSFTFFLAK